MKKAVPAVLVSLLVMIALLAELAVGNPSSAFPVLGPSTTDLPLTPDRSLPKITVELPELNKTYNTNNVSCSVIVEKPSSWFANDEVYGLLYSVVYYLDDGEKVTFANMYSVDEYYDKRPPHLNGTVSGLSDGNHSLKFYVEGVSYYNPYQNLPGLISQYYVNSSRTIHFMIDTTSPNIRNLSIGETLGGTERFLNFKVDEPTSIVTYCLDEGNNVTVAGNTTLSGLSAGSHNLTVYARDSAGNTGVQTINFEVAEATELFPWLLGSVSIIVAVLVAVAAVVYLKKRNRRGKAQ
jgi:hypothetical protein